MTLVIEILFDTKGKFETMFCWNIGPCPIFGGGVLETLHILSYIMSRDSYRHVCLFILIFSLVATGVRTVRVIVKTLYLIQSSLTFYIFYNRDVIRFLSPWELGYLLTIVSQFATKHQNNMTISNCWKNITTKQEICLLFYLKMT